MKKIGLFLFALLFVAGVFPEDMTNPELILDHKEAVNGEEFYVNILGNGFSDEKFDIKLFISDEDEKIVSQMFDGKKWTSNEYYHQFFIGPYVSGRIKLRIKPEFNNFSGILNIVAKVRDSENKKAVLNIAEDIEIKKKADYKGAEKSIEMPNKIILGELGTYIGALIGLSK